MIGPRRINARAYALSGSSLIDRPASEHFILPGLVAVELFDDQRLAGGVGRGESDLMKYGGACLLAVGRAT